MRRENTNADGEISRLTEWANELQEQKLQLTESNNQVFEHKIYLLLIGFKVCC